MHEQEADVCGQAYENLATELSAIHDSLCEISWVERGEDVRLSSYLDAVVHSGIDALISDADRERRMAILPVQGYRYIANEL